VSLLDDWKICPRCGSQLTHDAGVVSCAACGFFLYAHSAVATGALPEDDGGRVLLARRGVEPARGRWDTLGGFVNEGEHPLDGLRREVREETGREFEPRRFLGIWMADYDGRATLSLFWAGRLDTGDAIASDDVAELRWFARDELPTRAELAFDPPLAEVLRAWRNQHA